MGQILIRKLDTKVLRRLKKKAEEQGLSLEESLRRILAAEAARPNKAELVAEAKRIRAMSPAITKPPFSQDLIRESRDER